MPIAIKSRSQGSGTAGTPCPLRVPGMRIPPHFPAHIRAPPVCLGQGRAFSPRKAGFEHFLLFSRFPVAFPRTTSLTSSSPGMCRDAAGAPVGNLTRPSLGTKTNTAAGMTEKRLFWVNPLLVFVEVGGQRLNRLKGEQWFWLEQGIFNPESSNGTFLVLCGFFFIFFFSFLPDFGVVSL